MIELINFIILFFIIAFLSEIAGTITGFGSSTIFLPLALFFVDYKIALVLVTFTHIFGCIGRVTFFRQGLDKNLILLFGIPSVAVAFFAANLLIYIPQNIFILILGVFLLTFSILSLLEHNFNILATKKSAVAGSALSGFFAGLMGAGSVVRSAFLTAFGLEKIKYMAVAAAVALSVSLTRIQVYILNGFLKPNFYSIIPILIIIALCGSFVGKNVVNKLQQDKFRKIVLIAISIISINFIIRGLTLI